MDDHLADWAILDLQALRAARALSGGHEQINRDGQSAFLYWPIEQFITVPGALVAWSPGLHARITGRYSEHEAKTAEAEARALWKQHPEWNYTDYLTEALGPALDRHPPWTPP